MEDDWTFGESFYVPARLIDGRTVTIDGPGARHVCVVLRRRPGELIYVVDGEGARHRVELTECGPARVVGQISSSERTPAAEPELWLAVGLIRATRMDMLVEKCSEVGARAIVPMLTSRSLSANGVSPARLDRWRRIAAGAMTQSARVFLPHVHEPTPLSSLADVTGRDAPILLADPRGKSLLSVNLDCLRARKLVACVGPEGGFTPEETVHLMSQSATPVSLGKARLRTETAAAVLLDRLGFLLGL
jgi:16S rRNA (uracil1498-N3)-methyltransferase